MGINKIVYNHYVQRHIEYERRTVDKVVYDKVVHETQKVIQEENRTQHQRIDVYV